MNAETFQHLTDISEHIFGMVRFWTLQAMPPPLNRDTLPTIGSSRRQGMRRFEVTCANPQCRHNAMLEFDALGMDDSVIFIEIPRCQRFRCTKCGARKIEVFPDWSHLNGHRGTGRAHAQ